MSTSPTPEQQAAMQQVTQSIAQQLARGTSQQTIVKNLVKQGMNESDAMSLVGRIAMAVDNYKASPEAQRARSDAHFGRMMRGGAICVVGIIVTLATLTMASGGGGGRYIVCWGAIIFGAIDFLIGLFGWLGSR